MENWLSMSPHEEIRLECLKLAVQAGGRHEATDIISQAEILEQWVRDPAETKNIH